MSQYFSYVMEGLRLRMVPGSAPRQVREPGAPKLSRAQAMRVPSSKVVIGGPKEFPLLSKNCSGPSP